MKSVEQVQKDIAQHHLPNNTKGNKLATFLYRCTMVGMLMISLCLLYLINDKQSFIELPKQFKKFNFASMQQWIPFDSWFDLREQEVQAVPVYTPIDDYHFTNGSNTVYSVYDGICLHIQSNATGTFSLVLQQDNGVVATYDDLLDVQIKEKERILKGQKIGIYQDAVKIQFLQNQKEISYEKALEETSN